uniref:Calcium load-activated calcium channel n=1 Tax=Sus scrofa TaxID=9823 RepID=A0A8D0N7I0_PIG
MSTMFADTLLIVFISVCTALLAEGITWVLVYRTDKYKRLKAEVEKQSKKLEKKKETITESAGRQQKKKIERQEEKLKNNNRDLSMVRMKSMFAIGFCFTALMGMFNSIFDGRVVAKLPFTPLSYIQGLSHRNLLGDDTTDCSFIFLYILCTMSIRQGFTHGIWVSMLGVKSELQLLAYTRAIAVPDPSRICDLCRSLRPHRILNPVSKARDRTCLFMDTSRILKLLSHNRSSPEFIFLISFICERL